MGRSGKLECTNDPLIYQLLKDLNYEVHPDGTVWTKITKTGKVSATNTWRMAGTARRGYWTLRYLGKMIQIHRIIYARYCGPLEQDLVVNHIDANGCNNSVENLELVTQSKNNFHRFNREKKPPVAGNKVLDWETVRLIRSFKSKGVPQNDISTLFKISKGHVSEIVNNNIWVEGKTYANL